MQDVNDDMDDLFRKAAEQYPLKTDGADWQKVLAGLQGTTMPVAEEKEKRKRRALWLFLLLPLALVLGTVYYKSDNQPAQQMATKTETAKDNRIVENTQKSSVENDEKSSLHKEDDSNVVSSFSSGEIKRKSTLTSRTDSNISTKNKDNNTGNNAAGTHVESGLNMHSERSSHLKNRSTNPVNIETKTDYPEQEQTITTKNESEESTKKNESSLQPFNSPDRIDKIEETADLKEEKTAAALQAKKDSLFANDVKRDSAENNKSVTVENKSKLIKAKPRAQTGFYAGILASFDISTIKLQRINKTGYGFELLLGYRFSKRLSVESGVIWTKKNYYSTGKYFDKTNTGISPLSKIIYTNGSCAMYEIPAVVKYDFAQQKKSNWFATAGLSSYIMKDESYTYYANHSGDLYTATKKYKNSGNNLFSVASLSMGYQLQLNKHLSLRAEPYIKMPLSGIGIAKMPITSAGISAGFTRSF